MNLYSAVERLLLYQQDSLDSANGASAAANARCVLFHELCPALYAIMTDGLKPEVITSFGRMRTNVWRVVEAVTRQGPAAANTTCDLVMLLNSRVPSAATPVTTPSGVGTPTVGANNDGEERKFAGFVAGMLK